MAAFTEGVDKKQDNSSHKIPADNTPQVEVIQIARVMDGATRIRECAKADLPFFARQGFKQYDPTAEENKDLEPAKDSKPKRAGKAKPAAEDTVAE